ncbi:protein N-terminal asparagine amidohydrolase isoform X1 [Rhincodon typus]|uniref:protein N-terminal asparagine amidohydrolase isoform X1 n=1 Tax=Rhincodon typus TaxID=259920 RepID=UPI00202DD5DD|nr:protein N-terminal asparagine amidohydrolase isoform X1 [Rhincodon typus]
MPLLVSNRPIQLPSSTGDFIERYSHLKEAAKSLQSKPVCKIDPKGLLYVHQREFATTTPRDGSVSILGTEDATTCHMVVLRHTGSGATSLGHCDGADTELTVSLMFNAVKSLSVGCDSGRYEVHLVGGFIDERSLSHRLTLELLEALNCQSENIHLETYCLTELNDVVKQNIHWPVIYGIAVNVKTGDIFHATFPDRGPDEVIRAARTFLGGSIMSIYNAKEEQLQIDPYQWKQFTAAQFWLQQTDQVILQNFSTSPLVEPSHFVTQERSVFRFLSRYPEEPLFPKGRSRIYKKTSDGLWERIDCAA